MPDELRFAAEALDRPDDVVLAIGAREDDHPDAGGHREAALPTAGPDALAALTNTAACSMTGLAEQLGRQILGDTPCGPFVCGLDLEADGPSDPEGMDV